MVVRQPTLSGYGPGDVIAHKYRLVRLLGEGGLGAVWLAQNLKLGSNVAIKLIRPGLDAPDAAHRLLKEARAEAQLEHRAIVRVFDFGETEHGAPFIVMELLEGETLGSAIERQQKLEPTLVARILLPVVEALSVAHDQGIVHRDLKPENVFLARDGKMRDGRRLQPKVVDFGIAKLTQNEAVSDRTVGGTVLGTPAYMAPEQARGLTDVDQRVDTWALCVVLYEAVTGDAPFKGDNYNAVMRSVIEDEPRPFDEHGLHQPELWQLVAHGLQKHRELRFQTMSELGSALARWLLAQGVRDDISGEPIEESWSGTDSGEAVDDASGPSFRVAVRATRSSVVPWGATWVQPALGSLKPVALPSSVPAVAHTLQRAPRSFNGRRYAGIAAALALATVAVAYVLDARSSQADAAIQPMRSVLSAGRWLDELPKAAPSKAASIVVADDSSRPSSSATASAPASSIARADVRAKMAPPIARKKAVKPAAPEPSKAALDLKDPY